MAKKQLTIGAIKESISIYDEFIEIPVGNDESEYVLKVYPYFKPERVSKMVKEMFEFLDLCNKENVKIDPNEETDLTGFFITKEFTNIKFTKTKKAKRVYEDYKVLINSPLFITILNAIPEESIRQVQEYKESVIQAGTKIQAMLEKLQKDVKDLPLENRELLEKLAENSSIQNVLANPVN